MNILGIEPEASGLARLRGGALLFAILIAAFSSPLAARANVYASNVRVNGGTTNVALAAGGTVTVSYTLNEPATLGVAIDFKIGASTVRSIIVTNGGPGALQGTNSVVWDGKDGGGSPVGGGTYTVNVTPAASGYTNWAQISSDSRTNNQITAPRGVSVNNNINSPFFGRVFVGNANQAGASDKVGILKWNADGSPATEGAFSDGGYDWAHGFLPDNYSPYKIETGPDDRLYVSDFSGNGLIFSFDQTISSNSLKSVLRADNYPDFQVQFDGFAVSGSAGAIQLWVADERGGGTGIRHWNLTAGGTNAPGDTGTTVIQPADGLPLDGLPADVALDKNNNIYAIQLAYTGGGGESTNRLLSFAPYGGFPETNANWSFSTNGDAYTGAYGVAVDPSASYVAVGFAGDFGVNGDGGNGVLAVFAASNGAPVSFPFATNNIQHQYLDVAWDNAGNLYALVQERTDLSLPGLLRVFSPPGTNQTTSVALATISVTATAPAPPNLTEASYDGQFFRFTLAGESGVTYIIQSSTNFVNWVSIETNTAPQAIRQITVAAPNDHSFYRGYAVSGGSSVSSPTLSNPSRTGTQFQFMLNGQANASYIIQASPDLQSWTPVLTNVSANAVRPISVISPETAKFFRARVGP